MRPLTLGIVVSDGAFSASALAESPSGCDADAGTDAAITADPDADRAAEGVVDLRSASDLVDAVEALGHQAIPIAANSDLDLTLRRTPVDACLLALHGRRGGAGDVQALLAMRGTPHVGPPSTGVALAFDKIRARQLLAYHNLPVPAAVALGAHTRASERALELLGWPCYVKPRRGAHGLGITRVAELADVRAGVERAMEIDNELLLEREVVGREIQVVLLGERVLGFAEILERPDAHGVGLSMVTPPDLSRGRLDGIGNLARRAVSALGPGPALTRVDVLLHPRNNEMIIEVEPLPPLHRDSVVVRVARAAGLAYEDLVGTMLDRVPLAPRLTHRPVARPLLQ
ncbi:MAG: hypothetical protein JKY37_28900 [Nannocystaceae bacterium]|nr:hypothetical protein [Nannocystaceae bacterium]